MFNTLAHLMYGLDASGSKPMNGDHGSKNPAVTPATPPAPASPFTDDNHYSNRDAAMRKTKLKGKAPQSSTSPAQVDKLTLQSQGRAFSWKALQQVRQLVPTMMVFVGHGGLYFGFAILAKVANAVLLTTQSGPLQAAAIPWMMALYPVLVTRIYLSMVHYLHFGLPMKRPRMLGSYDGPGENYAWIDEEGMVFVDGVSGQWDDEAQEEETDWVDGDAEYLRPWRTTTLDLVPGRMTFAARESLATPSILDFRDEEY
ncbi:hypothetical protein GALMADRAFT_778216 [Galerina marginata CBS 339.88]|uniref:Uncharacterized protein n=1 Tax=Galerina marginata (strain CBS 339.88) TaxID=685588 RepID=A0A067SLF4_GALM3|nr:hypothetical protein GALMADRAFT_778216 [Galerina marginata CBS 339.88]